MVRMIQYLRNCHRVHTGFNYLILIDNQMVLELFALVDKVLSP